MRYEQLSDKAKAKARDWYRDLDFEWWDGEYEYFKEALSAIGFMDVELNGFDVERGAYVQWRGIYSSINRPKNFDIKDVPESLHDVVNLLDAQDTLIRLIDDNDYLYVSVKPSMRVSISVDVDPDGTIEDYDGVIDYKSIEEAMEDISDWMLKCLREQYEWICSDEYAEESIIANDYDFDEHGEII